MKILPGFFVWWMISSQLVGGAEVKPVEIGLFPFTNLTQDRNLDPWCRWLPEMLQTELVNASQRNFEVYLHGIRRQLTNAGWNGVQPVRRELAQSLSAKLHLDRMILGSFSRDGNGWSVKLEVVKLGLERPGALLNFHESQISKLRVALAVGLCDALGAKPYSESLAVWRNHPISDEAITKCSGLGDDLEMESHPAHLPNS